MAAAQGTEMVSHRRVLPTVRCPAAVPPGASFSPSRTRSVRSRATSLSPAPDEAPGWMTPLIGNI
eukprot:4800231-Pyramimonas_sp.AAC.1